MPSQTLFIESKHDKTPLQIYISYNPGTTTNKEEAPAIIIAHPYGPLGGNMNNNVVIAIQRHFLSCGYITACINFRGCGKSKGKTSWTGLPEREDYISVMDYLLKGEDYPKVNHLVLCGYSYGAMIANSITCSISCSYLLISIPLSVMWALATTKASFFKKQQDTKKVLCIHGDHDQFTSTNKFVNWCSNHANITDICIDGADHFWVDYEDILVEDIEIWRKQQQLL